MTDQKLLEGLTKEGHYFAYTGTPWKELSPERKQALVRRCAADKLSAHDIAVVLQAPSKNAVSGVAERGGIQLNGRKANGTSFKRKVQGSEEARSSRRKTPDTKGFERAMKASADTTTKGGTLANIPLSKTSIEVMCLGRCWWPVGDPAEEDFGYCGEPSGSRTYCAHHAGIAYLPKAPPKPGNEKRFSKKHAPLGRFV